MKVADKCPNIYLNVTEISSQSVFDLWSHAYMLSRTVLSHMAAICGAVDAYC